MEYNNYPTEDEQFEAADKAARQYLENVYRICGFQKYGDRLCGRGRNRRKARIPGRAFGRLRHTEIEIPSLGENGSNVPLSKTV